MINNPLCMVYCRDKVFVSGRISYSQYKDKNEATQRTASIIAGMLADIYNTL